MKKLHIIADGSIIAIANTAKYNETIKFQKNWTWKQFNDLMLNTNKDNLIVFNTTWDEEWIIAYLINEETDKPYFRKFEQSIVVTHGILHLVDWGDLTATLQFDNTTLPSSFNQELKIEIDDGFYKVIVKQLFNLGDNYDPDKVNFVIEFFIQQTNPARQAETIIWTEDFPNDDSLFL